MTGTIKYAPLREYFPAFDPLVRKIQSLDYWKRRLFFAKQVRSYPRFQYKYRQLPSDQDPSAPQYKFLADLIVENRFYLNSPREFNDPFDMTCTTMIEGSRAEIRRKFLEISKRQPGTFKKRRADVEFIMTKSNEEMLESVKRSSETLISNAGVFCFSTDPKNVLMWGHYGGQHTGVCLQFEAIRGLDPFTETMEVSYVRDYPVYDWLATDSAAQLGNIMTHKFKDWEYEKEWRLIHAHGAHKYRAFPPEALVGVIVGCRAKDEQLRVLESILKKRHEKGHPDLKVYEARQHKKNYALSIHSCSRINNRFSNP